MAFRDLRYDSCSISELFPFNEPATFTLFLALAATYARFAYKEGACLIAKVTISLCRPFRSPSRSQELQSPLPFARAPIFHAQWIRNYTRELIAKVFPSAKKFRYNGIMLELEKKLDIMFGRVVATGANVWVPNSGVLPPELRDVEEVASSEEDQQDDEANTKHYTRPITPKIKRVRTTKSGGRQMLIGRIDDLVSAATSISSAISSSTASRKCLTIADALEEISKFPEKFDDQDLYDFAVQYIQDKNQREAFMGLPTDRKVWFLKRRYQTSFTSLLSSGKI
ncbi:hypothetical protein M5K25_001790 [Dendrobium thyrsiflorum]|uniref:Uncharacterized protein n=1 Tax=Dendrobium thyrsiflorum TaxID=117978 RepID=A0ABD0VR62_DENTH